MKHSLKTYPEYFKRCALLQKPFELRKNDRDFQRGDILELVEYSRDGNYTGLKINFVVTYILHGPFEGLKKGYCIMGIKPKGELEKYETN